MDKMFIMLCCGTGTSGGFLVDQARKAARKYKLDATAEARSHTDVSGYLSNISTLMLRSHYGGEPPRQESLRGLYHVPIIVTSQGIYAQLNRDALTQLTLDTLGK